MAILKHIASKSSNYGAALEYLIFKHDEFRKTPILDQNGNRIMRDELICATVNFCIKSICCHHPKRV